MCGILISNSSSITNFNENLEVIKHRGPDYQGFINYENFYFGHTRLKIIDIDNRSNQPFFDENSILCFNGEIYNYKSLKRKYFKSEVFTTESDTEVLFKLLTRFGIEIVSELDGMFAFVFYEKSEKKLHFTRDYLGIKPLYFTLSESFEFSICSEIKGITSIHENLSLESAALYEFLLNGFVHEPGTGFKNIQKAPLGKTTTIDFSKLTISQTEFKPSIKLESFHEDLKSSINEQLVSDVPVGLFFSGGVDSSLLLAECKKSIKPYILGSKQQQEKEEGVTSDNHYARLISNQIGTELNVLEADNSNLSFIQEIQECIRGNEELIADHTFISSKILSREFRKSGHIVALSGMGADELFAGYNRYLLIKFYYFIQFIKPFLFLLKRYNYFKKKVERLHSFLTEKDFVLKYSSLIGPFSAQEIAENSVYDFSKEKLLFLKKIKDLYNPENDSNLQKALKIDRKGFLAHNFTVADKSTMSESIEMRVPLTSNRLLLHSEKLQDTELIRRFRLKNILKTELAKVLSKKLVDRRKRGFNPILTYHIDNLITSGKIHDLIHSDSRVCRFISYDYIGRVVDDHSKKKKDNTYKLYNLIILEFWLEEFFD